MNVSQVVQYREQVEGQKIEEAKLVEVDRVEKQKVEKILNKRKIWEIEKYLVYLKGFTPENDTWEKEKDLENTRKLVDEFKERMSIEVK